MEAVRTLCGLVSPDDAAQRAAAARLTAAGAGSPLARDVRALTAAQQVDGLVHGVLADLGLDPAGLRTATAVLHRRNAGANLLRFAELEVARAALRAAALPDPLVLKGTHLIEAVYGGDPGRRRMDDVDLLAAPGSWLPAVPALRAAGFEPRGGERMLARDERVASLFRNGVVLELHRRLARRGRLDLSTAALFARAVTLAQPAGAGAPYRALAAEDALVHLCVHLAEHAFDVRLRWVADLAWLVARAAPPLDWDLVAARARAAGAAFAVHRALGIAADLLGAAVPPAASRALAPRSTLRDAWYDLLVDHRSLRFARVHGARLGDLLLALPSVDHPLHAVRMMAAFAARRLSRSPRTPRVLE